MLSQSFGLHHRNGTPQSQETEKIQQRADLPNSATLQQRNVTLTASKTAAINKTHAPGVYCAPVDRTTDIKISCRLKTGVHCYCHLLLLVLFYT